MILLTSHFINKFSWEISIELICDNVNHINEWFRYNNTVTKIGHQLSCHILCLFFANIIMQFQNYN